MSGLVLVALFAIASGAVVVAGLRARRRMAERRARNAAAEAAAEAGRRHKLLNPDWDEYERATGRRVPEVLRRLYANADLVTQEDLVISVPDREESPLAWEIAEFAPARAAALAGQWRDVPPTAFHFASNWYGDPYYVILGEHADGDGSVHVRVHDAEDADPVAPSLAQFLSWPRRRAAPAGRRG